MPLLPKSANNPIHQVRYKIGDQQVHNETKVLWKFHEIHQAIKLWVQMRGWTNGRVDEWTDRLASLSLYMYTPFSKIKA